MNRSNGGDARFERIVHRGLKGNRRGFRHPVADRHLGHVHALRHLAHHVNWTWRARHDTGAKRVDAVPRKRWMFELSDEHRRHAIKGSTPFLLYRPQTRFSIE